MENVASQLIKKWKPRIDKLARRFANSIAGEDDLRQEGAIAILQAVRDHDPEKGGIDTLVYRYVTNRIILASLDSSYPWSCPAGTLVCNKKIKQQEDLMAKRTIRLESDCNALAQKNIAEENIIVEDIIAKYDEFNIGKRYFIEGQTLQEIAEATKVSCSFVWKIIDNIKENIRLELTI